MTLRFTEETTDEQKVKIKQMVDQAQRQEAVRLLGRYAGLPGLLDEQLERMYRFDRDGIDPNKTIYLHPVIFDAMELMVEAVDQGGVEDGFTIAGASQSFTSQDERSQWLATTGIIDFFYIVDIGENVKAYHEMEIATNRHAFPLAEFLAYRNIVRDDNWETRNITSVIEWADANPELGLIEVVS